MYYFQQTSCTALGRFAGYSTDKWAVFAIGIIDALNLQTALKTAWKKQ